MLINNDNTNTESHVKFISYTGRFPNLCTGALTLEIDGQEVIFGSKYAHKDAQFGRFWHSGGSCSAGPHTGEWNINVSELPEQFRKYAAEIDQVFNKNVERGCCGGCR